MRNRPHRAEHRTREFASAILVQRSAFLLAICFALGTTKQIANGCGEATKCLPEEDSLPDATQERARALFGGGEKAYDEGRFEEAAKLFLLAYETKPHPSVLFNVAQSYERLVDYTRAIFYFERYIKEAPKEAPYRNLVENRLRVLRGLPARIRVAVDPSDAQIELVGAESKAGSSNDLFLVPAGKYTLKISRERYKSIEESIEAEVGLPYSYSFRLVPETERLSVESSPSFARIFVDDKLVGSGRYVDRLPIGKHTLRAEADGRPSKELAIDLALGHPITATLVLSPPPASGRRQLQIGSTIYGAALTSAVVFLTRDKSVLGPDWKTLAITVPVGGLVGFAGATLTTKRGIRVGTSSMILGAPLWGGSFGLHLSRIRKESQPNSDFAAAVIGSTVAASGAILIAPRLRISAGDASLFNSGALWGAAGGFLIVGSTRGTEVAASQGAKVALLSQGLGMATGAIAARFSNVSRARVALIDLAIFGGAASGAAVASVLTETDTTDASGIAAARWALGGMGVGALLGTILTRNYDEDEPDSEIEIASYGVPVVTPLSGGMLAGYAGIF